MLLVVFYAVLAVLVFISFDTMSDRGSFGDMFGVLSSLFTALTLAGAIVAILIQGREFRSSLDVLSSQLELAREEFSLSKRRFLKAAQILVVTKSAGYEGSHVDLVNRGAVATSVSIFDGIDGTLVKRIPVWERDGSVRVYKTKSESGMELIIKYVDEIACWRVSRLTLPAEGVPSEYEPFHEVLSGVEGAQMGERVTL